MFIIVLLFLNQIVIYANEEHNEKEYVIDELGDYLGGFDYDSQSEVMLSQKYAINGSKNKSNIYFVKVNDDMIGAVTVSDYKGEKISAFLFGKEAFEDLSAGEETVVVAKENRINVCTNDETDIITGKKIDNIKKSRYTKKKVKYTSVTKDISIDNKKIKKNINNVAEDLNNNVICHDYGENYITNFVKVGTYQRTYKQVIKPDNKLLLFSIPLSFRKNYNVNGGVCWAAAGTSIINYKRGGTNFTTMQTYNWLKEKYGSTPNGDLTCIKRMWDFYCITMKYVNHKLSFTTVVNKMEAKKPIFCCFDHYEGANSNKNYAHAVALCGCFYRHDLKKYHYVYMDPNWAESKVYIVNHIPESILNGESSPFYYNPGDGTIYNNWRYAFY
ncbi:MAG: hypothetical protein HFG30_00160 [Eubacterium sp.]|nr:hypothetical protein [Eubacterium sp.]